MSSNSPRFTCASCGKEFRWKPEIAGRKAKCKCGQTLTVPAAPPPPKVAAAPRVAVTPNMVAPATEPNPLDWPDEPAAHHAGAPPAPAASTPACPSCGAGLPANAVLCVNCGYNLKTGKKIGGVASAVPSASASLAAPAPAGTGGPGAAYAGTYHRAKIDQVTTVEEETSSWQGYLSILAGVAALGLGVWQLLDPHDPGDPTIGRRRGRLWRQLIRWLYDIGGNGAVVGAFALIGLGLIALGVLQLHKKISTDD